MSGSIPIFVTHADGLGLYGRIGPGGESFGDGLDFSVGECPVGLWKTSWLCAHLLYVHRRARETDPKLGKTSVSLQL